METTQELIRKELQKITQSELDIIQQLIAIEALKVKIIPGPYSWEKLDIENLANVNCFAYALNLADSKKYHKFVRADKEMEMNQYFASPNFINFLIQHEYLVLVEEPIEECVVIYYLSATPTHAALWKGNFDHLESCWGQLGKIFQHELWRVPINYGPTEQIKFYIRPSPINAEKYFIEYCNSLKFY